MLITLLLEHLICLPPFTHTSPFNLHHRPGKCVLLFLFYRKEKRLREVLCKLFQVTQLVKDRNWIQLQVQVTQRSKHFSLWLSISDLGVGVSFITWNERAWVVTYSLCRSQSWNHKHLKIVPKDATLSSFSPYTWRISEFLASPSWGTNFPPYSLPWSWTCGFWPCPALPHLLMPSLSIGWAQMWDPNPLTPLQILYHLCFLSL